MNRGLHLLNALLLATLFGASILVWPELPERIPAHFDAGGDVTRWERASLVRWLLVPLIGLAVVVMNYGAAALLPRYPSLFNHPDKEAFLALPPARRAPVLARMQRFLYGISVLILILFCALQWTRFRTAGGADPKPYIALTLVLGILIAPVALGLWLPGVSREIREQSRGTGA